MVEKSNEFVITRVFDAARERVWKAWTEAERLKQWWGPKGFTVHTCKVDLRPGGVFHYGMRAPDGSDMWGKFVYREIVAPERIVWINSFSDEKGGLVRHSMHATWPMELLSTLTLAEHEGRTTLTLQWSPLSATDSERETFDAGHASMQQGWTGTFDQFAKYLAKA
ncbi:MAG: SRPBCC domain-containing protein [Pseudomonadota bacterium]